MAFDEVLEYLGTVVPLLVAAAIGYGVNVLQARGAEKRERAKARREVGATHAREMLEKLDAIRGSFRKQGRRKSPDHAYEVDDDSIGLFARSARLFPDKQLRAIFKSAALALPNAWLVPLNDADPVGIWTAQMESIRGCEELLSCYLTEERITESATESALVLYMLVWGAPEKGVYAYLTPRERFFWRLDRFWNRRRHAGLGSAS